MKLCPDTNILVRVAHPFDAPEQSAIAVGLLESAEQVVITLPVLCEFSWVLRSVYGLPPNVILRAVRTLLDAENVICDQRSAAFGIALAEAGGDFADGVIAEAGFQAGADRFVSFDRRAVRLIADTGRDAAVPG